MPPDRAPPTPPPWSPPALSRRRVLAALGPLAWAAASPGRSFAGPAPLLVLAAVSLTEALSRVAAAWAAAEAAPPPRLSFDATSRLARQISEGAPADLFVSADQAWVDRLAAEGHLRAGSRVNLLENTLVAVVPAGATAVPSGPAGLADPSLRRVALAGEAVPAGRYARAALQRDPALYASLAGRVVEGGNVRAVLAWVAAGEADVGVVYATDAAVEPRVRVAFTFAEGSHPPIVYPAAVLARSAQPERAGSLLRALQGDGARAIFAAAGFRPWAGPR